MGVLYRGGSDGDIRRCLIERNLLDAVVVLPERLLSNTNIPIAVLIFRTDKSDNSVLFINASDECQASRGQNILSAENIENIASIYQARESSTEQSHLASLYEIKSNNFNLSIQRYVRQLADEGVIDLSALEEEEQALVSEVTALSQSIQSSLNELGLMPTENDNV